MRRRTLIKAGLGLTAMSIPSTRLTKAAVKPKYKWRLVMAVPKTLPIWGEGVLRFANKIKLLTEGELDIQVFGAGELVQAMDTFEAVKSGKAEMGHSAAYYWQDKIASASFFCAVPFGLEATGMRAWLQEGGGQELWNEVYRCHGLKPLPAGSTSMQMGGWFKKEIHQIKDFQKLKIRMPGLGGKVLAQLGAEPMLLSGAEILTQLSSGHIDAAEWVGPYHDYIMGLYKSASFYYYPGWHEPGPILELMINLDAWNKLPKSYQEIVHLVAKEMDGNMSAEWLAKDVQYLNKMSEERQVKFREFPTKVLAHLAKISEEVKQSMASSDPQVQKVFKSYSKFQSMYQEHQRITKQPNFKQFI
ncbi:MAG: TRAP transporter substrate-binding protein [Oligoflexales bacterium]